MDDIRQFVVSGAEAAWRGPEGAAQDRLAAVQAGRLAEHYRAAGFDVVVTDVLLPAAADTWLAGPQPPVFVWLDVSLTEARQRARTRPVHLTSAEFDDLYARVQPPAGAQVVPTGGRSLERVANLVIGIWTIPGART
jgi:hypothetical protein